MLIKTKIMTECYLLESKNVVRAGRDNHCRIRFVAELAMFCTL